MACCSPSAGRSTSAWSRPACVARDPRRPALLRLSPTLRPRARRRPTLPLIVSDGPWRVFAAQPTPFREVTMSRDSALVSADWAEKNLDAPGVVFVEVDED